MLRFCWNICILELWRGRLLRVRWRYVFLELWGGRVLRFRVRAGACMSMGMGAGMHACMRARVRAAGLLERPPRRDSIINNCQDLSLIHI